jgi:FG-GAP-like repeat/Cysteine-rich secretory protein family
MAQPTAQEQQMLELINRMRLSPAAELDLLLNSGDAAVANALSYFNVNISTLTQQWGSLLPTAPLAWSNQLSDAALGHNQQMIMAGVQSHQLPGEAQLGQRANNASYTGWNALGENIYAYADSVFYGHAGFAIDWGNGPGGIQSPTGHRDNTMSTNFREVGIGITAATGALGPLVITQDFGNRSDLNGKAWLLGVAFKDLDRDRFYDVGEGLSGITVQVIRSGATTPIVTNTLTAGGYQALLDPGQYQLNFLQNALLLKSENVIIDAASPVNVKRDLIVTPENIMTSKPFLVNSFTTNFQNDPAITVLADGSFVITWSSRGQDAGDNSGYAGIYGQRFSRSGAKIGVEFQVNTGVAKDQANSSIAALADGGWVVVWASDAVVSGDIYGQRYNANGFLVGGEFQINGYVANPAIIATLAVTGLPDGGFVVTWDANTSAVNEQISGRRYGANGVGGSEFKVNTLFTTAVGNPATTYLVNGGWVVTWSSYGQDGDGFAICGQRYNSNGTAAGSEFLVNTYGSGGQTDSQVRALADGGFLVVWVSNAPDNSLDGIYAQRFDAGGGKVGGELQVTNELGVPGVTVLNDGGVLVTWKSIAVTNSLSGQRLDASGNKSGPAFLIDSPNVSAVTESPVVATLPDGRVVLAWTGAIAGEDGNGGIVARILDTSIKNDFGSDRKSDILWRNSNGAISVWQMDGYTVQSPGLIGSLTSDWVIQDTGDFNADGKSDILWRNANGAISIWQMNGSTVQSAPLLGTLGNGWVIQDAADFNGDGKSDILWRNANGAISIWQMNGSTVQNASLLGTLSNDWVSQESGDFNGDGKADLLWRNTNGAISIWQMDGSTVQSASSLGTLGTDWVIQGVDDFNGDGKDDLLWRNTNGAISIWQMDGSTVQSAGILGALGNDWAVAGSGDYNGDGTADILWRNTNGSVSIWQMNNGGAASAAIIGSADSNWQIVTV